MVSPLARALVVVLVATSCATARPGPTPPPTAAALQPVVVATELTPGRQRLPIGVLDGSTPVNDARVHVRVYRNSESDPLRDEAGAPFKGEGLEGKGVYVAYVSFGAAGQWIAEISAERPGRGRTIARVPLRVTTTPTVPSVGQPAPRSRNPTKKDVADVADIDSGRPPDDMHDLSIADSIARRTPSLVVFATPAFCTSQMCGPQVRAVQALEPTYRDRLAFIHVEIYEDFRPDPSKMHLSATVQEWHLQSEPWVFLIDSDGIIRFAFEGPAASDELRSAVEQLLAKR